MPLFNPAGKITRVLRSWTIAAMAATSLPAPAFGQELLSFTNAASIALLDESPATPYPSTIAVSGFTGELVQVTITLRGFNHSYPDDIDILLVGPGGIKSMIMSDAGGSFAVQDVVLTLDDAATKQLPNSTAITSGIYLPANWGSSVGDDFPAPAPTPPYLATFSGFNGISPNGSWSLYIRDDIPENGGVVENGWSLTLRAAPPAPPALTITHTNSMAVMAWSATSTGYTLESSPALGTPEPWVAVTNPVTVTDGQLNVTLPLTNSSRFFRLRK